ncbi:MAG TPA: hypothetical protein VF469_26385 [Kofleriaceae bacterium]
MAYGPPGLQEPQAVSSEEERIDGPPGLQPPRPESAEDRMICAEETPTGSNITRTVCRSEAEAQRENDAGKAWMEQTPANPAYKYPDDPLKRGHL